MNIALSYIDYNLAGLKNREQFSYTTSRLEKIYQNIYANNDILGVVIISTCNRTEIYLSLSESVVYNPFKVLCDAMGIDFDECKDIYKTIYNNDVLVHLCNLSCGLLSQIFGEGQIITQVKDAITLARNNNVTDNLLEVFFRTGIACGKKVRTLVEFKNEDHSTAKASIKVIKKYDNIKNVLVIGNGAMGRLVCNTLTKNGYNVFLTLRQYKYHTTIVPKKVTPVKYDSRYEVMENMDAVISATTSPHYTISYDEFKNIDKKPNVLVDLAVPRDIDINIKNIENLHCYNIDNISYNINEKFKNDIKNKSEIIMKKYINDFYKWYNYKNSLMMGV